MTVKICHVTSAHNTDDIRILKKECVSLAGNNEYNVFLVGRGKNWEYKKVKIIGVGASPDNRFERMTKFAKKVIDSAIKLDADIYHLHDPELLLYLKKLKKTGAKIIFDSHENYYEQIKTKKYLPKVMRYILSNIYAVYQNYICRYLDGAIYPVKDKKGLSPFGNKVKNIEFINNFPNLAEFEDVEGGVDAKGIAICYVGSISEPRGIEPLIEACYIKKVKLILAGKFSSDEYRNYLESKKEYSIVDYRGICDREEIKQIYKESTIGASNLLNEGQYPFMRNLPTKVYEYMAVGLPFFISDFEFFKEFILEFGCGIVVCPSDPKSIVEAIVKISSDEEYSKKQSQIGKKLIKTEFNWSNEEKKLFSFYKKVYED